MDRESRSCIQHRIDFMEANLRTELSAAELSAAAGFSLYYYYRLFREATGMSVMHFLLRRRLLHAIYEISRGATAVDTVLSYGFDTYAGFYRAFVREFGLTPREYLSAPVISRPARFELQKETSTMTHREICELLPLWGLASKEIRDVLRPGRGTPEENVFYIGEDCVLKISAEETPLRRNAVLASALDEAGLPAAVPIRTLQGKDVACCGGRYLLLIRRLPETLRPEKAWSMADYEGKGRYIGEAVGRLHHILAGVNGSGFPQGDLCGNLCAALPVLKEEKDLDGSLFERCAARLEELAPGLPRQLIHRDPNPGNILLSGDGWGFTDFDLSEVGFRLYDPCYAATAVLSETFSEADGRWFALCWEILRGYDSVIGLTDTEKEAVPLVILAIQATVTAWFARQGEPFAAIYETNRRMTSFIAENTEKLAFFD